MQSIVHVARSVGGSGGVEALLALHLRERSTDIVVTLNDERSHHPNHRVVTLTPTDCISTVRRNFSAVIPPGSIVIYHNAYLLSIMGAYDRASSRIIYWHSWDIPRAHLWRTGGLISSHFFVSSSLVRLIPPSQLSIHPTYTLPLPARINATQKIAPEWKPTDETSARFAYIGRLEKRCKRADRIPALAQLLSDLMGRSSIDLYGEGALSGSLGGTYGNCDVIERGWLARDELERELMSVRATIALSDQEGFGLMAVDSLSLGLPVIFPNIESDVVSILRGIDPRLVYPPGDLAALVRSMKWLSELPVTDLMELSEKSRKAVRPYTVEGYLEIWDKSIQSVSETQGALPSSNKTPGLSLLGFLPLMLFKAFSYYFT